MWSYCGIYQAGNFEVARGSAAQPCPEVGVEAFNGQRFCVTGNKTAASISRCRRFVILETELQPFVTHRKRDWLRQ